jgi:DNA-binding MarR family transcriptional regulator
VVALVCCALMAMPEVDAGELLQRLYLRPGFLLRRAHQLSVGIFEEECREIGLTPSQYGVLTVLDLVGACDQSTVARALGFDRVTTMRVVRGLEARGLLRRTAAAGLGRRRLTLTADGRHTLASGRVQAEHISRRLLSPLQVDERAQLLRLLRKLCAGLEDAARTRVVPPGC